MVHADPHFFVVTRHATKVAGFSSEIGAPVNFAELPFDAKAMIEGLRPWVECESPTFDAAAVDRMIDLAASDLAAMGATIERIPGRLGFGGSVRGHFAH